MEERIGKLFARAGLSEQIVSWSRLEKGYSNLCFRVVTDGRRSYKVRFAENNDVIDRGNERRILEAVGVRPLYYGENGDSVWEWIEGRNLERDEVDGGIIGKLVEIAEEMHGRECWGVLDHDDLEYVHLGVEYLTEEVVALYEELVKKYEGEERCLCHNDISLSNLIYEDGMGKLSFIDYEWGRVNNPCWDYGNFVKEVDLGKDGVVYLAERANISVEKLMEFAVMASCYSIQLSFVFREQTVGLENYRRRLKGQISKYRQWLSGR